MARQAVVVVCALRAHGEGEVILPAHGLLKQITVLPAETGIERLLESPAAYRLL